MERGKLKNGQNGFTRMLPGLEESSCKERLDRMDLFAPGARRLRGGLIEVYKIMRVIQKMIKKKSLKIPQEVLN